MQIIRNASFLPFFLKESLSFTCVMSATDLLQPVTKSFDTFPPLFCKKLNGLYTLLVTMQS